MTMKIVFDRDDILRIITNHVADMLQCSLPNLKANSTMYGGEKVEITVLSEPKTE